MADPAFVNITKNWAKAIEVRGKIFIPTRGFLTSIALIGFRFHELIATHAVLIRAMSVVRELPDAFGLVSG